MPQARHFRRAHRVKESDILAFQSMNIAQPPQLFTRLSGSHCSECFPGAGNNTWQVRNPIIPFGVCERAISQQAIYSCKDSIQSLHCCYGRYDGDGFPQGMAGEGWNVQEPQTKYVTLGRERERERVCVCVCVCVLALRCVWLFVTPRTVAHQAPLAVSSGPFPGKNTGVGCRFLL